jgi:hypothetical protein
LDKRGALGSFNVRGADFADFADFHVSAAKVED